jgi:hypothetical protein
MFLEIRIRKLDGNYDGTLSLSERRTNRHSRLQAPDRVHHTVPKISPSSFSFHAIFRSYFSIARWGTSNSTRIMADFIHGFVSPAAILHKAFHEIWFSHHKLFTSLTSILVIQISVLIMPASMTLNESRPSGLSTAERQQ